MDASYLQSSFLGGEWSPYASGRFDKEQRRTALSLCSNALPVEEGAWTRRPGLLFAAVTRSGARAILRNFAFTQSQPYALEFTAGHMRMFEGLDLVLEDPVPVVAISSADPAVVKTLSAHGFSTNDQVQFTATPAVPGSPIGSRLAPIFNRQFLATVTDSTHFSLSDPVTGNPIDGSVIDLTGWLVSVARVVDFATPYTDAEIAANQLRLIQNQDIAIICDGANIPKVLQSVAGKFFLPAPALNTACFAEFNFADFEFKDGPYLDPPTDGTTLTPGGTGSPVVLTASSIASINGGLGFQPTDVGRLIRLFSEPAAWAQATAYTKGQSVKWQNAYWTALQSTTGNQPDVSPNSWAVAVGAAAWTWGTITVVGGTSVVTVALQAADPYGIAAGGTLLNGTQPIVTWRLGLYSDTTGYPTGGCFQGGRFWLFGAQKNRADACMSDNGGTPYTQAIRFDPTAIDGTVADDNGIAAILEASDTNAIFWMIADEQGVIMGTEGGEWLIQASNLNDPITPFSADPKRKSKFGCANVEPRRLPLALAMVDRYTRKLIEYIGDVFSNKFLGFNLTIDAAHLTKAGIAEIAYVQERTPIIWARMGDGTLKGCTYKRESPFGSQPAAFYGWHQHTLGSGRVIESIQGGPSPGGETDALVMVTNDPTTNVRFVEMMPPQFAEDDDITAANFLDSSVVPTFAQISGGNAVFYGLNYIAGQTITAWVGGVDGGDFAVAADGSLTVPLDVAGSLLTTARLAALDGADYGYLSTVIEVQGQSGGWSSPVGAQLTYVASSSAPLHFADGQFDWDKGIFYSQQAQHSGDPGSNGHSLFVFNIATRAQLAGPLDPGELASASGTGCMGYDGNIYYGTIDGTHLICRFNTTSHTNDITYSNLGLDAVGYVAPMRVGGFDYVVYSSLNSGITGSRINVIQMTGPAPVQVGTTFTVDEAPGSLAPGNAFLCRGPGGAGPGCYEWGTVFALSIIPGTVGLYQVFADSENGSNVAKLGTIVPTAIDAGWTTFNIGQPLFDETDGNVIVEFINGANTADLRLVKIIMSGPHVGTLAWKLTVTANNDFSKSRIRGGRMSFIDGTSSPYALKVINTLTGAIVTNTAEITISPAMFSTDDKAGMLIAKVNDIGTTLWGTFGPAAGGGTLTPAVTYTVPVLLGYNFASRGQLLRRVDPQEVGAANGPALGKTKRNHQAAFLLVQTQGLYIGTDFGSYQRPAPLTTYPGAAYPERALPLTTLFDDVCWAPLEDPYSFNGMVAWEIKRPYPATVASIEGFVHTQDR